MLENVMQDSSKVFLMEIKQKVQHKPPYIS